MRRVLSLLLVVALIVALAVPVSADGNSDGWIELLEQTSIQSNGENWFEIKGQSTTITFPLAMEKRLVRIEMLVWHQTADYPSAVSVITNGVTNNLTVTRIENNLSRIYGTIPTAYYEYINIKFQKSTTGNAVWEMLSCKVSPIAKADYDADAELFVRDENVYVPCPGDYSVAGDTSTHYTIPTQFPIIVYDWRKYDSITIVGSVQGMGLNSVRATIGTVGLPYEITYTSTNTTGSTQDTNTWTELYHYEYNDTLAGSSETTTFEFTEYNGKVLYNLTIDLTGIDRSMKQDLTVYFTGVINTYFGYTLQVVGVTGSVNTADTASFSWWNRFTTFMTDLFGGDDPGVLDDLGDSSNSISSNTDQIHGFEQSQQAVLDNNFAQIQTAVTFTNFAAALVFVQKYANMTFSGISGYAIVFTLPLFLGLFFYLCSRIPGITRWKTPPPRSKPKGGGKP